MRTITNLRKRKISIALLLIILFTSILLIIVIRIFSTSKSTEDKNSYWTPRIEDTIQIQYSDYPIDLNIEAYIYDVDLFETQKSTIDNLHSKGKKVICYINVGAWEEYRDDANSFSQEVIGNEYEGWEGENWLDISRFKLFSDIMEKRFDLAKEKGCDGIDPDNVQGYIEDTGFDISYDDQLEYNKWISEQSHERNMSIGLKNDPDQVQDLIEYFDWAVIEDCQEWDFCEEFEFFIEAGKPVFQVEYTDTYSTPDNFCKVSLERKYYGILKNRDLDSWMEVCEK